MGEFKCRYCGGKNLVKTDDTFGVTYDYVSIDGCYCCNDCFEALAEECKNTEAFLIDYLELCKKHDIYIVNWGECRGPKLYKSENNFYTMLLEEVGKLKGGTIRRLKENRERKSENE